MPKPVDKVQVANAPYLIVSISAQRRSTPSFACMGLHRRLPDIVVLLFAGLCYLLSSPP
jgi:hypothetical protein